jgi:hypothetical protein
MDLNNFFFFFAIVGIELGALCLVAEGCLSHTPGPFAFSFVFQIWSCAFAHTNLKSQSSCLYLPRSWNRGHEPPCPAWIFMKTKTKAAINNTLFNLCA